MTGASVTLVVDSLGPRLSGIGRYVLELCDRIPQQPGIAQLNFYLHGRFVPDARALLKQGSRPRRRGPRWLESRLSRRRLEASLVHAPNYFLPRQVERGIVTVHDLSVFRFPQTHPPERLRVFERDFEDSLAKAAHVITDSEAIRSEVVETLGLSADDVTAIPLGVDEQYKPRTPDELAPMLAGLGLAPGGYALCVSTLEPRKKIAELLHEWRDLPAPIRDSTPLVLAGPEGWLNEALHEQIREGVAEGWLRHLGFVAEAQLPALYAGAVLFLYPSVYEGFGLPPLEAMASGVPVLVSNTSSIPEVCGEAAAYANPEDPDGFQAAIVNALLDDHWREQARSSGLARAKRFSWESCAERTVETYRRFAP